MFSTYLREYKFLIELFKKFTKSYQAHTSTNSNVALTTFNWRAPWWRCLSQMYHFWLLFQFQLWQSLQVSVSFYYSSIHQLYFLHVFYVVVKVFGEAVGWSDLHSVWTLTAEAKVGIFLGFLRWRLWHSGLEGI